MIRAGLFMNTGLPFIARQSIFNQNSNFQLLGTITLITILLIRRTEMQTKQENNTLSQSQDRISRRFRDEFVQKNLEYQREVLKKQTEKQTIENRKQEPET
jgi:predicted nuclease of restriction endonuclease-like (RecB) superfamily